jgi:putative tricarboxylic transport membrane protein
LRPVAALFRDTPEIVYGFIWGLMFAGIAILALSLFMAPVLVRLMRAPSHLLVPGVAALAVVGSFAVRGNVFDVYIMLGLGVLTYFMTRMGMPVAPIALGIIIGPIVESGMVATLNLARSAGFMGAFVLRPISAVLIVMSLMSIAYVIYGRYKDRSRELVGAED